jgi:hypothetical protein
VDVAFHLKGSRESVVVQPTSDFRTDMPTVAEACGCAVAQDAVTVGEVGNAGRDARKPGPAFAEIHPKRCTQETLGRPKASPSRSKIGLEKLLDVQGRQASTR